MIALPSLPFTLQTGRIPGPSLARVSAIVHYHPFKLVIESYRDSKLSHTEGDLRLTLVFREASASQLGRASTISTLLLRYFCAPKFTSDPFISLLSYFRAGGIQAEGIRGFIEPCIVISKIYDVDSRN